MNTCFGSKLVGSAFVQLPQFGRLPLDGALSRNGCSSFRQSGKDHKLVDIVPGADPAVVVGKLAN